MKLILGFQFDSAKWWIIWTRHMKFSMAWDNEHTTSASRILHN
jgi:hypothetical protein